MAKTFRMHLGRLWPSAGPKRRRPSAAIVVTVALLFAVAVNLFVRRDIYFTEDILPSGDYAANDMQIVHGDGWLHGNYSATGFYHPGPAQLVVMRGGEILFYRVLPLFRTPFAAQIFSTALLALIALAALGYVWIRATRSVAIGLFAFVVALITMQLTAGTCPPHEPSYIMKPWPPDWYVTCAMYFATGCLGLLCFGMAWLPLAVFGAGLLVHGHASFIGLVPIMCVVVAYGAWRGSAARPASFKALMMACREHPVALAICAGVAAIFALPVLVGMAIDPAVNIRAYFAFAQHEEPQSPAEAIAMLRGALPWFPLTLAPYLLPAAMAGGPEAQAAFSRLRRATLVVFGAGSAAAVLYAFRGAIRELFFSNCFLLLWYSSFSAMLTGSAAALLGLIVRRVSPWIVVGASVAAIALFATPLSRLFTINGYEPAAPIRRALDEIAGRLPPGEMVSARVSASSFWSGLDLSAMLAVMWRGGHQIICVSPRNWSPAFHEFNRCNLLRDRIDPNEALLFGGSAGATIAELPHGRLIMVPVQPLPLKPGVHTLLGELADPPGFGWSPAQAGWLWSDGEGATLRLRLAPCPTNGPAQVLRFHARAHLGGQALRQDVVIKADGQDIAHWGFTSTADDERRITIPAALACRSAPLDLTFLPQVLERPQGYGLLADRRRLGIGLAWVTVE